MQETDYKKYKWFFTSSDKLVVGGKSAEQNDELLTRMKKTHEDYVVMHTSHPGSPFCIIISGKITKKDIEEAAIFTGCFSRAWKEGKKETEIHIFNLANVEKGKGMKTGTWQVKGKIDKIKVKLELALVKQKGAYRAVPLSLKDKKSIIVKPGKIDKIRMIDKIIEALGEDRNKRDEVLSALPAGGVEII